MNESMRPTFDRQSNRSRQLPHSIRQLGLFALPALALAACEGEPAATPETGEAASEIAPRLIPPAPLIKPDGTSAGSVTVEETPNGVGVTIAATGLAPGAHGVHLHAVGKCDAPKFESAGAHWNPAERQHGRDNPQGSHLGDLANIAIASDGSGESIFSIGAARLGDGPNAVADADGTSLVIHAKADDYKTDPSGNSGDRIACAVLTRAK